MVDTLTDGGVVAFEEIRLLKARRDRFVDTKDWEALEALHAPDHHSYNDDYAPWETAAEMITNVRVIMAGLRTAHHSHTPRSPSNHPREQAVSGP